MSILSIWSWDAWDSSMCWMCHPSTKRCHEALGGTGGGLSSFSHTSSPQGYRHGEGKRERGVSKAVTFLISLHTRPVSCHESPSGPSALIVPRLSTAFKNHTDVFFSWFWERRFPVFVCIAVRRAKLTLMMSSHSCEVICECVQSLLLSVCRTQ